MLWTRTSPGATPEWTAEVLFRVIPWNEAAAPADPGGALFVARDRQRLGRHDAPDRYGALYLSVVATSAVAEMLKRFRGRRLPAGAFNASRGGLYALAAFDDSALPALVDLDDAGELARRSLRPSEVATSRRRTTQLVARAVFDEGVVGFAWWSTIEATWTNVTLFAERSSSKLRLLERPLPLTIRLSEVVEAARYLEIDLSA
jgi:RES domain